MVVGIEGSMSDSMNGCLESSEANWLVRYPEHPQAPKLSSTEVSGLQDLQQQGFWDLGDFPRRPVS